MEALAKKQPKWRHLSAEAKLDFIHRILDAVKNDVGSQGFLDMTAKNLKMMGMPATTSEGQAQSAETAFFSAMCIKQTLFSLQQAYELRTGQSQYTSKLTNLLTKKAINGQVVAQIIPGNPASKLNPFAANNTAEIWFEEDAVKETADVKPFDFDSLDKKSDKIAVILGAGNWDFLAVNDVLISLFVFNQVCFLKHHPLRGESLEPLVRKIFAPVIQEGFFDSQVDMGAERNHEIVYSPLVSSIMLTGGKKAHDNIVWGQHSTTMTKPNEPKLKANMYAELGAVSPWIVPPAEYSNEELNHIASNLASAIFNNGSCNCNCPKVLVLSKHWTQGDALKQLVTDHFSRFETPCAYYPGSKDRYLATKVNMKGAKVKVVESKKDYPDEERKLSAPMFGKEAVTLPLLTMEVEVDMSTEQGRQDAMNQHAFRQESFAPTFCFANLIDNGSISDFLDKGVTFCNDVLFGTLSCTMTVPPSLEGTDAIEKAIADLQYGQIVTNGWAAIGFVLAMPWGGHPGKERNLASVETGSAKIFNWYFLPHIEKAVIRTPIIAENHILKPPEFPDAKGNLDALEFFVSASLDPADVTVGLNARQAAMVSKLQHQISYHQAHGETEEALKVKEKIDNIWRKVREVA